MEVRGLLQDSGLFHRRVSLRDPAALVIKLGSKRLYPWSRLAAQPAQKHLRTLIAYGSFLK